VLIQVQALSFLVSVEIPRDKFKLSAWRTCFNSLGVLDWLSKFVEVGLGCDAFSEDLVEFFLDVKLALLQIRQVRDHDCVLEVGHNHLLEHCHVIRGKLSKAVVHHTA